ncbi:radical SAM protein [Nocardia sp. CDC160]|uniref:radical SAM protein n=1 Tax=Nocardia sp. CDC160 TaxID=3112166 RepID=UPI002DBE6366|nr:radical SAM protein [Nocardia sp. CDC160]MEC3920680.1 radical SAM protein [Nocardia sp. CDC160]
MSDICALVDRGVSEVTLLGRGHGPGSSSDTADCRSSDCNPLLELMRACRRIDGLERVRIVSSNPADFTDEVVETMSKTPNVCPQVHLSLRSGSDRMLAEMQRPYRRADLLRCVDTVRTVMPYASLTADVVIGYPGETDEDFEQTLSLVRAVRFATTYTHRVAIRSRLSNVPVHAVPGSISRERVARLIAVQARISLEGNQALLGSTVEVLVTGQVGNPELGPAWIRGRTRDGRTVYFPPGRERIYLVGDIVMVQIVGAAQHYMAADTGVRIRSYTPRVGATSRRKLPSSEVQAGTHIELGAASLAKCL